MREMVGGCCVCSDDRGWSENPLVYCDGQSCTVAVHQACYGIVTVPTGPWYCRKCESQERSVKVKCELCPSKYGALKRTDNSGWAHVVCALYIPEVRFGNVTTMEPIQLQLIPAERFSKLCYICEEKGKAASATVGACMQCNRSGCKQQFHVTCAQTLGLLCEEAGNYLDNVKYCGYCQHHYSKLKKWGNVKTIPPYKPVSSENQLSDSNSDRDTEAAAAPANNSAVKTSNTSPATSKRKSSSGVSKSVAKSATGRVSTNNSTPSGPKTVHSGNKGSNKLTATSATSSNNNKSAKVEETTTNSSVVSTNSETLPLKEPKLEESEPIVKSEPKDTKSSKKRKTNSRTPTPVSVSDSSSVVISSVSSTSSEKKTIPEEKPKKMRIETTQSIITNQPVVALTSISSIKVPSPLNSTATEVATTPPTTTTVVTMSSSDSQQVTTSVTSQMQPINSLVVSLPLTSTSSHHSSINNHSSVLANAINQERSGADERNTIPTIGPTKSCILPNEKSNDGLKITFEAQEGAINRSEMDMDLELPSSRIEEPSKRSRSQSNEKSEKQSRGKKRSTAANGITSQLGSNSTSKRAIRAQHTPSPTATQPQLPIVGVFSSVTQSQLKDSPPSSPSSESQGALPQNRTRTKGRKSAPASIMGGSTSKDIKDIKLFQNGISAPHMLGNQLNPNSNMAQKMSDHLNSELEAHSIFTANDNSSNLVGPQLHLRLVQSARASSVGGSSTASGGSGISSMISGTGGGNIPQTLDQLLERQWEQGSQFLMEQAQHFDIASLLSCLHQLRAENLRLEEDLTSLLQRRDHLLAVNARLAIPLTGQPNATSNHPHTVNNIHPAVGLPHGDLQRPPRSNIGFGNHPQGGIDPIENGLSSDQGYAHRSPLGGSQPSPTVRHPSTNLPYNNSGLLRQSADSSGRSAPRPQPFPMYQNPGPSQSQPQVVLRRDADIHHPSGTKPS